MDGIIQKPSKGPFAGQKGRMEKYLIAMPTMDMMPTETVSCLVCMKRVGAVKHSFVSNSLVYDARNMLAAQALDAEADRILWIDSDMQFAPDLMERLAEDMDEGRDFVSGLYFRRRYPIAPIISKAKEIEGKNRLVVYSDYPKDTIFEVDGAGFGACMMTTKIVKDIWDRFGSPFYPINGQGEDYSFCERAKSLGYKLYCDSRIKVGHVGQFVYGEQHYLAQK